MKRNYLRAAALAAIATVLLSGCTLTDGKDQLYFYERPAVGFTVEDKTTTNIDIQNQNWMELDARDAAIHISASSGKNLQIIEKRRLKGPASKKSLKAMLGGLKCSRKTNAFYISLSTGPQKELKPFFRMTEDIEIRVPETLKSIYISGKSGSILMAGLNHLTTAELSVIKGSIHVADSSLKRLSTKTSEGDLDISSVAAGGEYSCNRGNIKLKDVKGSVKLKSISGESILDGVSGQLNCDSSTGSLTLKNSRPAAGSVLYSSYGDIDADLGRIEASGKYILKASKGNIRLSVPRQGGWSLLTKVTWGSVVNHLGSTVKGLEKAPSGAWYGDVSGGGALIDAYVDRGSIILGNGKNSDH